MKLAINAATTMKAGFAEDLEACAAAGWNAIELWLDKLGPYLERHTLAEARTRLRDSGLAVAGACYHFGVMLSEGEERRRNLDEFRRKLDWCEALGALVLVVPTDFPERKVELADYERVAAGLREAADLARPHGVALAVEFIKGAKLIGTLATARDLVRRAGADNAGILLDTFHFSVGASKMADLATLRPGELRLVHINDLPPMPFEIAEDRDRVFPGEGALPLREILAAVAAVGYDGYASLELFDEALWAQSARDAARTAFALTGRWMKEHGHA
jgi:sugar phosphate isomerase/epimerase